MLDLLLMFFTNLKEDEVPQFKKVELNIDVDLTDNTNISLTNIDVTQTL